MGLAMVLISAIAHFSLIPLYYTLDRFVLVYYNIGSTTFFVILTFVLWRYRKVELVWSLSLLEFAVSSALSTIILGLEASFAITSLFIAGVAAVVRFAPPLRRALVIGVLVTATVAAGVYSILVGPSDPFPRSVEQWLLLSTGLWVGPAVAIIMWYFMREMWRAEDALESEYQRSEHLLNNIMPAEVAERLKSGEGTIADGHPHVTVLFADIVGFTERSSRMAPDKLVVFLNRVFSRFDELVARHDVEKIKTIGDAYLAVAGMPRERADHADAIAQLALDIQASCDALRGDEADGQERFDNTPVRLRIGIHSGAVVAGVIGASKFAYDLWGDVVNTASRMESSSEPGKIQVSEATYDLLAGRFAMTERGTLDIKGKGEMRTWFLEGRPTVD